MSFSGIDIGVEHERSAECHPIVSGTNVKDVAWIAVAGVTRGINVVNDPVESGRPTPALMPPIGRAVVHTTEKA